jgi:ferrous iron transport protein B
MPAEITNQETSSGRPLMNKQLVIALSGNPNSGKTTIFNELTGSHQHVGNYPGVTVEKKEGVYFYNGEKINIVDLPGTYSLTAYSIEEQVARDFIARERPDAVVDIVDASNLERNLYLCVLLMEMGISVIVALNMMDMAKNRGIEIDTEKLSSLLSIPIVETVGRKGSGLDKLIETAATLARSHAAHDLKISYGEDIDLGLDEMEKIISGSSFLTGIYPARWTALKYLEKDEIIRIEGEKHDKDISSRLDGITGRLDRHLEATLKTYPEALISDYRYGYIKSIVKQATKHRDTLDRLYLTDRIDRVLTHRLIGPIAMIAVIFLLYKFTFTCSSIPVDWLDSLFGWFATLTEKNLPDSLIKSLIVSGLIDGVGGVVKFVPLIMLMFLGIAALEDSGYLARIAYMLDRIFRIFGLHGSSVMSYIVSGGIAGGCAVPGIMATRTIKSPRERLATMLTAPFMNCGAKLPVFAVLVAAFFAHDEALVMILITIISWLGALTVAWFLRSTVVRGESTPFVMELPPYRLPTMKGLIIHSWERTWQYLKKAGTIILAISIVLWALMTFPVLSKSEVFLNESAKAEAALKHSIAGWVGSSFEGISSLAGFDWRTNIALIGGFAAKEVIVSTLGTAYSLGAVEAGRSLPLSRSLSSSKGFSPLTALSLIIFIIFYSPCFATIVCIVRESGSWKWGVFSFLFNTILAFMLAITVYQTGRFIGY